MSWSFSAIGRSDAVGRKADGELLHPKYPCTEPEESIRQGIGAAIKAACDAAPDLGLQIEANGHQTTESRADPLLPGKFVTKVTYHTANFKMSVVTLCE